MGVLPFPFGLDQTRVPSVGRARAELLFVGAMHRDANVDAVRWFHDEILPRVRAEIGEVRFTIAGASPPAEIQRLASPGVEVTGFVESLEPLYARATVFVAPLRIAGGIAGKTHRRAGRRLSRRHDHHRQRRRRGHAGPAPARRRRTG